MCIPCRYVLVFWGYLGFLVAYMCRVNLSVALVAMVNSSSFETANVTSECPDLNPEHNKTMHGGTYEWNQYLQGIILGSFFWGYLPAQSIGAYLSHHYSAKWSTGIGILIASLFTMLTPISVKISVYLLIAGRVIQGLGEGLSVGGLTTLYSKWSPPLERSRIICFGFSGAQSGTVIGQILAGILCQSDFMGGWPSVFYIFGALGVIWFVFWVFFVFEGPEYHPRISEEEKQYILNSFESDIKMNKTQQVPWLKIFSSPVVLGVMVCHFCSNWLFYTCLTSLPTYMASVLRFRIDANGLVSSLPYLFNLISMTTSSYVVDLLRTKKILSTVCIRKIVTSVGMLFASIGLVSAGFVGCNDVLAIVCLCFSLTLFGISAPGFIITLIDVAPQFSGTLISASNTIGTIPGILSPYVVGVITSSGETRANWMIIFYITLGLSIMGLIVYLITGRGEIQHWARITEEEVPILYDDQNSIQQNDSRPIIEI